MTNLTLRLKPVTMHQLCFEASLCYALLHKGHSLDPVGKDKDLWGIALPHGSFLHQLLQVRIILLPNESTQVEVSQMSRKQCWPR